MNKQTRSIPVMGDENVAESPVGQLSNGDDVWPGPTYLVRIHGDAERHAVLDICELVERHFNVLARVAPEPPDTTDETTLSVTAPELQVLRAGFKMVAKYTNLDLRLSLRGKLDGAA